MGFSFRVGTLLFLGRLEDGKGQVLRLVRRKALADLDHLRSSFFGRRKRWRVFLGVPYLRSGLRSGGEFWVGWVTAQGCGSTDEANMVYTQLLWRLLMNGGESSHSINVLRQWRCGALLIGALRGDQGILLKGTCHWHHSPLGVTMRQGEVKVCSLGSVCRVTSVHVVRCAKGTSIKVRVGFTW